MTPTTPSFGWRRRAGAVALALGALASPALLPAAHADLFADNDARRAILDLRTQLAQLQQDDQAKLTQQAQQIQQMRNGLLDLSNQIDQLKSDIAQIRGQQDTATRQLNDALAKLAASQQSLNQRLTPLEPVTVQIGGKSYSVQPAEKAAFEQALTAFRGGDFNTATTQFKAFTVQYPASPYDTEAHYWLGNSLYAQQKYKDASAEFEGLIQSAPDAQRAPEAMLGLASCQVELREVHAARQTLGKLVKNYPKSEAAQAAKQRLAKLR